MTRSSLCASRVTDANQLQAVGSPSSRSLVDWSVRAIRSPATRWDGLTELASLARVPPSPDEERVFTGRHLDGNKDVFLKTKVLERSAVLFLRVLEESDDPKIASHAVGLLKRADEVLRADRYAGWWVANVVILTTMRMGDDAAISRFDAQLDETSTPHSAYASRQEKIRYFVANELRRLKLDSVPR